VLAVDSGLASGPRAIRMPTSVDYEFHSGTDAELSRLLFAASRLSLLRIPSEWGISGVVNCFRRLKVIGPVDDPNIRLIYWETAIRLFNYRARVLNLGQIRTVFGQKTQNDLEYK